jgi:hypothetical protein
VALQHGQGIFAVGRLVDDVAGSPERILKQRQLDLAVVDN